MSETFDKLTANLVGPSRPQRKAKGYWHGDQKKIAIGFDPATFKTIALKAEMEDRSFAEQVRHYVELGRKVDARRG